MSHAAATVDVCDMLCAQALALTDRAMRRLSPGAVLEVRCNTQDVEQDLVVWARDRGHAVVETLHEGGQTWLRIRA